jgi:hypothetical protein
LLADALGNGIDHRRTLISRININPEGTFPAGVLTILTIACAA